MLGGAGVMEWRRAETVGSWSPGKQDKKIRPLYTERRHMAEHGGTRPRREKAIFGHFSPILVDAMWRRGTWLADRTKALDLWPQLNLPSRILMFGSPYLRVIRFGLGIVLRGVI